MYYYITEPLTTKAERRKIDEIKSLLSQLGIAGEFAVASPARTVEEHLELAFRKGFTTVVGIGSDALACKVAGTILSHHYDRAVMGMIPLSPAQEMWSVIGVRNLRDIGEALRSRRLQSMDVLMVGPKQGIITDATIQTSSPVRFELHYKEVALLGKLTDVVVSPNGEVKLWDREANRPAGFLGRLFGGSGNDQAAITHLAADRWQLATAKPCDLTVSGQIVAQTPLDVVARPKALKLIVNRAIITPEKETTSTKES